MPATVLSTRNTALKKDKAVPFRIFIRVTLTDYLEDFKNC